MRGEKKTDPFYSSDAWRRARRLALERDMGQCQRCKAAGRMTVDSAGRRWPVLATMVHHKAPLRERPDLALDLNNLMSLCDRCHDEMHPEKRGQKPKAMSAAERMGIPITKWTESEG